MFKHPCHKCTERDCSECTKPDDYADYCDRKYHERMDDISTEGGI